MGNLSKNKKHITVRWLTMCLLVTSSFCAVAQGKNKDKVYESSVVKRKAEFPGGTAALDAYIAKKIKIPSIAWENAKSGVVLIEFAIEKDGSVSNVKVVSKKKIGYGVEEAAIQVIKKMPKWSPALQDGKPVRMMFRKPIRVRFNNG